jgi:hypothetical protein
MSTSSSHSYSGPRLRAGAVHSTYHSIGAVHLDGQVDEAAAEPLHEVVHRGSHPPSPVEEFHEPVTHETGSSEADKIALGVQRLERVGRPWWQRPSATW